MSQQGRPVHLYAYLDEDGSYLYIGQSYNLYARRHHHMARSPWWSGQEPVILASYDTRREALDAEAAAIRQHRPKFNVMHNDRREARGQCAECLRLIQIRADGRVPLHRDRAGQPCDGGHALPIQKEVAA